MRAKGKLLHGSDRKNCFEVVQLWMEPSVVMLEVSADARRSSVAVSKSGVSDTDLEANW